MITAAVPVQAQEGRVVAELVPGSLESPVSRRADRVAGVRHQVGYPGDVAHGLR